MTEVFSDLDHDKGMDFDGTLSPYSVVRFAHYFFANKFLAKCKQSILQLQIRGDLFGYTIMHADEPGESKLTRVQLNLTRAMGTMILDTIDDEAALRLHADINSDLAKKQTEQLKIEANGRLIFNTLRTAREYEHDIDSLKLNDVTIMAELGPHNMFLFHTGIEFKF